jgi:Bacterial Ig-like domain (group 3)/Beta-propeller repeat
MKRVIALGATLALLFALLLVHSLMSQSPPPFQTPAPPAAPNPRLVTEYGRLPLSFETNEGQTDRRVKFLSRGAGRTLFLTSTEVVLTSGGKSVARMKLLGANRDAQVTGLERLPGNVNYFLGKDPANWHTGIPTFSKVRYNHIYPGVDLVYYGNQRELEYDFVIAPEVDPAQISLAMESTAKLWIDPNGDAILHCAAGDIRLLKPHLYQRIGGHQADVSGRYRLQGHELKFVVGRYDHHQPLVIDPVLVYSTYVGGSGGDSPTGVAVDSAGNAYVTGQTNSLNFPGAPGNGKFQNFVVKLNASGNSVLYSTYVSGSGTELSRGIAVDGSGDAYISGYTNSTDFPVKNALQSTNHGGYDAFVAELDPNGNLLYSTYLGGSKDDEATAIALDSAGNVYLTGQTSSTDLPGVSSTSAQASLIGTFFNAFVAKLNATGSAVFYATYLGGNGQDTGEGIAVDSSGNAYVAGNTASFNFPTTANALQRTFGGGSQDGFVTQVNAGGTGFNYSTYLGGSDNDFLNAIALDAAGNAYLTGRTASLDFPGVTASSLQSTNLGSYNAVVAKLNPTGTALLYSTYLGGFVVDTGNGIAVDTSGNAYVAGTTRSTNFPVMNAIQRALGGGSDAFVSQVNSTGTALLFSTYLGGSGDDGANGIAMDSSGSVYITGDTASANFPTANPLQTAYGGNNDAFVAKLSAASAPVTTNTTLFASMNPSVFGQQVSFSVTVTPTQSSSLTPTGSIMFNDGSAILGTVALTSGTGVFNTANLAVGSHSISASYPGDNNFSSSTSAAFNQTVDQARTTTTLAVSPNTSNFGQGVTFTATVTPVAPGAGVATGTVTFLDGATTLGTSPLNSSGSATFSTSSLSSGSHTLTASYGGNTNFTSSATSSAVTATVQPPPPPVVQVIDNETIHVADTASFLDVFDAEQIKVMDAITVTPLINVGAPVASFSAGSLGFGNVPAGQTGTQSLTLSDIGQAPLAVSSAVVSLGSAFAIAQVACSNGATSLPTTLPVGGACTLLISYASPSGAASSDTLTFTDNAALSNLASAQAGASYMQSISLNGSGTSTPPPPPPPAVIPIVDNEAIQVMDTPSFPDVFDSETITVSDQVTVQIIPSPTTTSISAPPLIYGTPAIATVYVSSPSGTVAGNAMLSVDGGTATSMSLSNGSAVFNLGVLKAGNHLLAANFPAQGSFTASSSQATFIVTQATPTITWTNPAAITYGTALGSAQLNATASVPGTFVYNPSAGAVLGAGNQTLSVTFTPTDTIDYTAAKASIVLPVNQATPTIKWPNPAAITYGTALSAAQLNATTSVPGSFAYSPAAGTVLTAGSQKLSVSFSPTDSTDYTSTTAAVTLQVSRATPAIKWPNPVPITYATPLGATQLNATASVPGTFAYSPAAGSVLSAGSQTLSVKFSPADSIDYAPVAATVTLQVTQATPAVTWTTPAPIPYGTPLGSTQLDAMASVPGTFVYTPPAGTVLSAGIQTLSVIFAPNDSTDYTKATASVTLQVVCGALINLSSSSVPVGGTITVTASVISCTSTKQTVVVQFLLNGPSQPNTCSSTKSVVFTTPPFTLAPKTSQTVSFPFKVPSGVCPGTYSITATTLVNGVAVNTSTASLTITAH